MTTAYPLAWPPGWPKRPGYMGSGPFKGLTPEKATNSLKRELKLLPAHNAVISSNLKPRNFVGETKADARYQPGVALYFTHKGRQVTMAQDVYSSPYANMRSLALAIEAMRQLERHGGGYMMERAFDGFSALPPPENADAAKIRPWREVLEMGDATGPDAIILAGAEAQYRALAKIRHPDRASGSVELMAELNAAIAAARKELGT